ncbi:M10 family metallopeptidase C-terminal domain-containing protein [Serratia ficaria]|uniref:M10 family metallopeptidase C-terminal domain-containing protein n=2 Tax=Serratia ficaria TaxID=61651 RepID=UPI00119960CC|nr:calcium-binding protein [Serratia ficaria]CAI0829663.1 Serralysin G precursor [Serratia ficaria]CAI1511983.1 Serralysin G precursor [Serratia ficaria]CAI1525953.1 Serralysin G precursor [Serratia ficaria]CAI1694095.1 Serralysin G precursor [Serratia ficaria]CAI2460370.1 Serralysin G precursor [Serratia ficaria]
MNNFRLITSYLPEKIAIQNDMAPFLSLLPNVMLGTAGDDVLKGTPGKDFVLGFAGDDIIKLNTQENAADTVFAGSGEDEIYTGSNATVFAGADADYVRITDNSIVFLGDGDDRLQTELDVYGHNTIFGGAGSDRITTNYGIYWGIHYGIDDPPREIMPQDDKIYGGSGDDWITPMGENILVHGDEGNDNINVELLSQTPTDNGRLYGDDGDDTIYVVNNDFSTIGQMGTHFVIDGGTGNDLILSSSSGGDTITGGAGNDVFFYEWVGASTSKDPDVINDFTFNAQEQDKIDLSELNETCFDYYQLLGGGVDSELTFIGYQEFSGNGKEVRLVHTEDGTNVEVDPFVEPGADLFQIQLTGVTQELTQEAFILTPAFG